MSLALVLLIVLGSAAVSIVALVVVRRLRPEGVWADPGRAAGVLGAARSPFGVVLALVVLVALQGYNAGRDAAQHEAGAVLALHKTAEFLPADQGTELEGVVTCYARAVIALDWPAMADQRQSIRVDNLLGRAEDAIGPSSRTAADLSIHQDLFDELLEVQRARDDRLAEANGRVPSPVWIVILLGAGAILLYVVLFADPRESLFGQAVMAGTVAIVLVGGLMLVAFLSRPYADVTGSLRPTAMQHTLTLLQSDPEYRTAGAVPCEPNGQPLV